MAVILEYIWIDGNETSPELRSKTKIIKDKTIITLSEVPEWSFDGSSTNQAEGSDSDCILKPVAIYNDPMRGTGSYLVLNEVLNSDRTPHKTNKRSDLKEVFDKYDEEYKPWFGIEQEYTLYEIHNEKHKFNSKLYKWPDKVEIMPPQGRYYCGVGGGRVFGREIAESHMHACIQAGLNITGINAEVMPSQWEYQIGAVDALTVSDQIWVSRWMLQRISEEFGAFASFDPKPLDGDWNGAGAHINFSTKQMREKGGYKYIVDACEKLGEHHEKHINLYGNDNEKRLTGQHETCDINTFKYGVSDRGASIRIPIAVKNDGNGYLEDRRPAANVDPYLACRALIETVCS